MTYSAEFCTSYLRQCKPPPYAPRTYGSTPIAPDEREVYSQPCSTTNLTRKAEGLDATELQNAVILQAGANAPQEHFAQTQFLRSTRSDMRERERARGFRFGVVRFSLWVGSVFALEFPAEPGRKLRPTHSATLFKSRQQDVRFSHGLRGSDYGGWR